ncbi:hypothetical protein [Litorihabitans aurantiacus]|uniref:Uncharacterized protein n=1 Tax=Litorihabitans aurantiacus TaxID=1930061 RepID=A0AA37XHX3_9MICO|nr:hypothetical protein [Litorihabitans aurantiacus]GMA32945.1 hypothetical protein GCM10025875_29370 [Litorihabitans aurantiacus]
MSLLSFGFRMLGGDLGETTPPFAVGYLGLSLVALIAVAALWRVASGGTVPVWLVRSTLTLLVIGTVIATILGFVADEDSERATFHVTFAVFVIGIVLTFVATDRRISELGAETADRRG